ncbi:MAG: hypothetical protein RLP15_01515 [Cryomorphaceae bacterium]
MEKLSTLLAFQNDEDVFTKFELAAHDLINHWIIQRGAIQYSILEIEFFLKSEQANHLDPFIEGWPVQQTFGRWMLLMSGVELTIGEKNRYGSIRIRSLKNLKSGKVINGPQRVFKEIFEDAGNATEPDIDTRLVRFSESRSNQIIAAPRVGLNLTEFSDNMDARINYILRPYRFISLEVGDMADKYVAYLYLEKAGKNKALVSQEHTIFKKYLHAFDEGLQAQSLDVVWEERSKSLRLARLMGYLRRNGELIEPRLSNVNIEKKDIQDVFNES